MLNNSIIYFKPYQIYDQVIHINQDENLIFYVLHSDFDNNIMPMQSLTSDQILLKRADTDS